MFGMNSARHTPYLTFSLKLALQVVAIISSLIFLTLLIREFSQNNSVAPDIAYVYTQKPPTAAHVPMEMSANLPIPVVLVTTQLSGASVLLDALNKDPDIFQVVEPLDSVFMTLYGTPEGYNVPSDIFNFWNGTEREVTGQEAFAMAEVLQALLTCQVQVLPTETLLHKFWRQFDYYQARAAPYIACYGKDPHLEQCRKPIAALCGGRFGDMPKAEDCFHKMYVTLRLDAKEKTSLTTIEQAPFISYKDCLDAGRVKVVKDGCVDTLKKQCESSKVVLTKVVRANMEVIEKLLEMNPKVKVIHLLRNPVDSLGVINKWDTSIQGMFSNGNSSKEAMLHCRPIAKDITKRQVLSTKYPESIMELNMDLFLQSPVAQTENIYKFLNIQKAIPDTSMEYLNKVQPPKDKAVFSNKEVDTIQAACKTLLATLVGSLSNIDVPKV